MNKIKKLSILLAFVLMISVSIFFISGCSDLSSLKHTLSLSSSNVNYGSVYGAGVYAKGEDITIYALPNDGYEFEKWSDNNTQNPRTIKIDEDKSLTASFVGKTKHTLSLISTNPDYGSVYGAGTYVKGDEVTIYALPEDGYEFEKWSDNNTQNPRTITMSESKRLIASFVEKAKYAYIESVQISLYDRSTGWGETSLVSTNRWTVKINGYGYGGHGDEETLREDSDLIHEYILNGCRTTFHSVNNVYSVNNKLELNKDVSNVISFGLSLNIDGSKKDYTELIPSTPIEFNASNNQLKILYHYPNYGDIEVNFIYNVK
ncbi:MAG: hypothetical protein ACI4L7_01230 [Christensenellales bacterium]